MDEQECFNIFLTLLTKRPHVAENLLKWLEPRDIGNCLKTSEGFRTLVCVALQWSNEIKKMLDDEVSRWNLTSRHLDTRQYGPIQRVVWSESEYYSCMNGFGIDGSLWISGPKPEDFSTDDDDNDIDVDGRMKDILSIYYLDNDQADKSRSMPVRYQSRLMANILPNSGVMVQDQNGIKVLRKENGSKSYEILQDSKSCMYHLYMIQYPYAFVFGRDCVYKCEKIYGTGDELQSWKLTFCDADGHFITGHALTINSLPEIVIQKVFF